MPVPFEVYEFRTAAARWMAPHLRALQKLSTGERAINIGKIAQAFEDIEGGLADDFDNIPPNVTEGLELFGKLYLTLWD